MIREILHFFSLLHLKTPDTKLYFDLLLKLVLIFSNIHGKQE